MQVLAINQNATIERLVSLSSGKMGYTLKQYPDVASAEASDYSFVIIDSELYQDGDIATLKTLAPSATCILIASKNIEKPQGFDVYLEKPFLPTELVEIYLKYQDNLLHESDDGFGSEIDNTDSDTKEDNLGTHIELDIGNEHEEMAMPSFDVEPSDLEPIEDTEEDFSIKLPEEHDELNVDLPNETENTNEDLAAELLVEDGEESEDFTFNLDSVIESGESTEDFSDNTALEEDNELNNIALPDFNNTEVDVFGDDANDTETSIESDFLSSLDESVDLPDLNEEDSGIHDFMSDLHEDEKSDTDELLDLATSEDAEEEFNFDDMLERASADLTDENTQGEELGNELSIDDLNLDEELNLDDLGDLSSDISVDNLNLDDSDLNLNLDEELNLDSLDDVSSDISVDDLNLDDSELDLSLDDDLLLGSSDEAKDDTLLPEISDLDLEMPSADDLSEDIDFKFDAEDDAFASSIDSIDEHSILDEEDVNEIKDLLDVDTEQESLDDLALDTDVNSDDPNFGDELASDIDSLSEEMMASALGVDIDSTVSSNAAQLSDEPIVSNTPNLTSDSITAPEVENLINALKAALADDNVTINITITKNG